MHQLKRLSDIVLGKMIIQAYIVSDSYITWTHLTLPSHISSHLPFHHHSTRWTVSAEVEIGKSLSNWLISSNEQKSTKEVSQPLGGASIDAHFPEDVSPQLSPTRNPLQLGFTVQNRRRIWKAENLASILVFSVLSKDEKTRKDEKRQSPGS